MSTSINILRGQTMKAGDTLPNLRVKLVEEGDAFNLVDYSVSMRMKRAQGDSLTVDGPATIEKQNRGIVAYSWSSSETETAGTYEIEFVAEDNSGNVITFPNIGTEKLYIQEELN